MQSITSNQSYDILKFIPSIVSNKFDVDRLYFSYYL